MNILILNSIGKKKWGGGEKWMIVASKELQTLGHNVTIGSFAGSKIEIAANAANIRFRTFSIHTDFSIIGAFQIKKYVEKEKIDIIIACQNRDVRVSGISRLLSGQKHVIISRQGINRIGNSLKYRLTFTKLCDGIITNTGSLKELYDSYGWWDSNYVKVIHNGLETTPVHNQKMDLSQWFNLDADDIVVVSSCRLAKQKNLQTLIEAAAIILKTDKDFYFAIAGEGSEREFLQQKIDDYGIGDNVKLIGFVKDISSLLNSAHIFALTSLYEGMPNSILEAMYHQLPVVASMVNGVPEIIDQATDGFLFSPKDSTKLAELLVALKDPQLRKSVGLKAKEKIEEKFSAAVMAKNYEQHMYKLLQEHRHK
jgi:glycosyltransferase involved in cell wall biosynthesis